MAQVDRAAKAQILRDSAEEFRQKAEGGVDSQLNTVAADLLERRAARIAVGEDDNSLVNLRDEVTGKTDPEASLA
ncbi:hypothetical protein [Microbacterium sp. LWO12-1.2]|uniref:hypothetical protein n=1 Tax=Microbacterium sp. LWO12-1.2 TaxID=3135261 RepID=UPI00341403AB